MKPTSDVDTLGTRKQLEQKHLREFIRILGYDSGCCLTCHAYAVG